MKNMFPYLAGRRAGCLVSLLLVGGLLPSFAAAQKFLFDASKAAVDEKGSAWIGLRLSADPGTTIVGLPVFDSGSPDLQVLAGQEMVFDSDNYQEFQYFQVDADSDRDRTNDRAVLRVSDLSGNLDSRVLPVEIIDTHAAPQIIPSANVLYLPEGDTVDVDIYLSTDPNGGVDVQVSESSSLFDVVSNTIVSFDSTDYWIPKRVTLLSNLDTNSVHQTGVLSFIAAGYATRDVLVHEVDADGRIIYVDQAAASGGGGTSWLDAYNNLRVALQASTIGDQVWVAQGTYTPDAPGGRRAATFTVKPAVAVFGGFFGNETHLSERDPNVYVTILSGDLNGDDTALPSSGSPPATWKDNSYHVVYLESGLYKIVDGFTITGGNADVQPNNDTLLNNSRGTGAGVWAPSAGFATVSNCDIHTNFATTLGAGLFTTYGMHVYDCLIRRNRTYDSSVFQFGFGGGLGYLYGTDTNPLDVVGCNLVANDARDGGGAWLGSDSGQLPARPQLKHSQIGYNTASNNGGGVLLDDVDALCEGTTIAWNSANGTGGGMYAHQGAFSSSLLFADGMFLDNDAAQIGGLFESDLSVQLYQMIFADFIGGTAARFERGDLVFLDSIFNGDAESVDASLQIFTDCSFDGGEFKFGGPNIPLSQPVVSGPGTLQINTGGTFTVQDGIVATDVRGLGTLRVSPGWRCRLNSAGYVRMDGDPNLPKCSGTDNSDQWGRVLVEGDFYVSGGTIEQSNIEVRNDSTIASCGNGTGGRLILEAGAQLECNRIISYDDRHLFIKPSAYGSIVLENNDVTLIITPDVDAIEDEQGKLLELWAEDIKCPVVDPNVCQTLGFCQLAGACPDYTSLANARELIILENARVNLTNRPGFDVGPPEPETMYVENVILEPNAVLNLGLQELYYEHLTLLDADGQVIPGSDPNLNGSQIINIPKLGFPLEVIRFEDQCEFDVRVRREATGGSIERTQLGDEGVMFMEIFSGEGVVIAGSGSFAPVADDSIQVSFDYRWKTTSTSFCNSTQNPDDTRPAIVVYLSDDPTPGKSRVEIARVYPPSAPTMPGGIFSSEFTTFRVALFTAALGTLDLSGGAYVELQMCGANSSVYIDNWDPIVDCASITPCDITGDNAVTEIDFLTVLSGFGEQVVDNMGNVNYGRECLDKERSGFVDSGDVLAWDMVLELEGQGVPDACGFLDNDSLNPPAGLGAAVPAAPSSVSSASVSVAASPTVSLAAASPDTLLIAGKSSAAADIAMQNADYLYEFALGTPDIATACPSFNRMKPANGCNSGGHGKLIAPQPDDLYQLHADEGLIRLRDGLSVVRPGVYNVGMDEVVVGVVLVSGVETFGLPLLDAAFNPSTTLLAPPSSTPVPQEVFVGPVIVVPGNGNCPYYAVLGMTYSVGNFADLTDDQYLPNQIYGLDPAVDPCIGVSFPPGDCWKLGLNPDYQRIKELAHDGTNLFVISASAFVDDYLITYETNASNAGYRISNNGVQAIPAPLGACQNPAPLGVSLPENPTAMFVDPVADLLFLAKGASVGDGLETEVYIYELVHDGGGRVAGIQTPAGINPVITINQPAAEYCTDQNGLPCAGSCNCDDCGDDTCNYVSGITSIVRDPNGSGETFAVGFSAPLLPSGQPLIGGTNLFTSPTIAEFDPTTDSVVSASLIACDNLMLPISAVLSSGTPRMPDGADYNGDCAVNAGELDIFDACSQGPDQAMDSACTVYILDADSDLDMGEIAILQQQASSLPM